MTGCSFCNNDIVPIKISYFSQYILTFPQIKRQLLVTHHFLFFEGMIIPYNTSIWRRAPELLLGSFFAVISRSTLDMIFFLIINIYYATNSGSTSVYFSCVPLGCCSMREENNKMLNFLNKARNDPNIFQSYLSHSITIIHNIIR